MYGFGSGSIHRLRISTKAELFGLETIPVVDVLLTYKGRSVKVRAGLDTGADPYLLINPSLADRLGLPKLSSATFTVVGGGKVPGYTTRVDALQFIGASNCYLKDVSAAVVTVAGSSIDLLIGEGFLKEVGATISYTQDPPVIMCSDPDLRWLNDPFSRPNTYLLIAGGLFLAGFLVSLSK